jgi:uncharacterized repeat protein (TIGR01451 family)
MSKLRIHGSASHAPSSGGSVSARRPLTLGALVLGVLGALLFTLFAFANFGASAAPRPSTAYGSAFGESVDLTLTGGVRITSGPLPTLSGTAPPDFDKHADLASARVSHSDPQLGALLTTGVLSLNTKSNVQTGNSVHSDAAVDNTSVNVAGVLDLRATVVKSEADVGGTCGGALTAVGKTTIASGSVNGTAIRATPAPNTEIFRSQGIRIVVNEQGRNDNGTTSRDLTVNAIHIYFTNVALASSKLLNGSIIISQSRGRLSCAPPEADLVVTKTAAPDPVTVGQELTYTVDAKNNGPDAATNVVVTDTLPAGANFTSAVPSQGTCTGTGTVTCNLGAIANGATAKVTIKATITKVINSANVKAAQKDPNTTNNSVSVTTSLR